MRAILKSPSATGSAGESGSSGAGASGSAGAGAGASGSAGAGALGVAGASFAHAVNIAIAMQNASISTKHLLNFFAIFYSSSIIVVSYLK